MRQGYMRFHLCILAVLLAVAMPALADTDHDLAAIEARQKSCLDKDTTNSGMIECAGAAHDEADKLLNKVYAAAAATMKGGDDAKETLRRLVASERAWVAYRDAECEFEGASMIGGSGESLVVADCLYVKTAQRVKDIGSVLDAK